MREEYKAGWNPEDVVHTVCAFANDIDNWGGGYIVVGIEERDGLPIPPAEGLGPSSLDAMQKNLVEACNRISPSYMPLCEPVAYNGARLLLIWAPGGFDGSDTAPESLSAKRSSRATYIRRLSSTAKAKSGDERDLAEMGGRVPFDDRANNQAEVSDMRLGRMQDFLNAVGSSPAAGAETFLAQTWHERITCCRQARRNRVPTSFGEWIDLDSCGDAPRGGDGRVPRDLHIGDGRAEGRPDQHGPGPLCAPGHVDGLQDAGPRRRTTPQAPPPRWTFLTRWEFTGNIDGEIRNYRWDFQNILMGKSATISL